MTNTMQQAEAIAAIKLNENDILTFSPKEYIWGSATILPESFFSGLEAEMTRLFTPGTIHYRGSQDIQKLITAIETGHIDGMSFGGSYACAYGHLNGQDRERAGEAATLSRIALGTEDLTPMENLVMRVYSTQTHKSNKNLAIIHQTLLRYRAVWFQTLPKVSLADLYLEEEQKNYIVAWYDCDSFEAFLALLEQETNLLFRSQGPCACTPEDLFALLDAIETGHIDGMNYGNVDSSTEDDPDACIYGHLRQRNGNNAIHLVGEITRIIHDTPPLEALVLIKRTIYPGATNKTNPVLDFIHQVLSRFIPDGMRPATHCTYNPEVIITKKEDTEV